MSQGVLDIEKESLITQEYLKIILEYNPETGDFTWKQPTNNSKMKVGDIAGCLHGGYRKIGIDGKIYLAHRLAWLYMTGSWPEFVIDHIEGTNISNFNKWDNLRHVTQIDNTRHKVKNGGIQVNNNTGYRGVSERKDGKWVARISVNGKKIYLGYFKSAKDASIAYENARLKYYTFKEITY